MKTRRSLLASALAALLIIAALGLFGSFRAARHGVPASTKVTGLSPSEAEILYANAYRVLDTEYRYAVLNGDFKGAWFGFCNRYFSDIETLERNTNGAMRVAFTGRWPGKSSNFGMEIPAGWQFPAGWQQLNEKKRP